MAATTLLATPARRLAGKVALITGGANGIGSAIVRLFYKHGAKVVVADIQDAAGTALCQDLDPSAASFVHCDVANESDVASAVDSAVSRHGHLDVMVNNAGIMGQTEHCRSILDADDDDFRRVLGVNLVGPFLGTKHAARVMLPRRRGSIVMTASVCSVLGGVSAHAYTSSKHGLVGLARNTAVDLGRHGIRVNCVSPYVVPTQMSRHLLEREEMAGLHSSLKGAELTAVDVAEAVVYLGSDDSKYVSGHNLVVDGGFSITNPALHQFFGDN